MTERDRKAIYPENFLVSVACEIRFLPLLEIQNKIPLFQKEIRKDFPAFNIIVGARVKGLDGIDISSTFTPPAELKQWLFSSEDQIKTIRVGISNISVVVTQFSEFKEFHDLVSKVFEVFQEIFKLDKFTRIGLRFTNDIHFEEEEAKNPSKTVTDLFYSIISSKRIKNYDFSKIQSDFRWKKEENKLILKNNYYIDPSGFHHYIIDIDAYSDEIFTFDEIDTMLKKLNMIAVDEFHDNIKDKLIEDLRRFNDGKSK